MDTVQCIKTRRSIRKFLDKSIERDLLNEVIELASFSPSWKNTQIPRYIVLETTEKINELADNLGEHNKNIVLQAPVVIVMSMVKERCGYERDGSFTTSKEDRWEMFDAGVTSQTLSLAIHNAGLGCVIMGVFDEDKIASIVNLPDNEKIAAIIPVGYPETNPPMPKRKSLEEIARYM